MTTRSKRHDLPPSAAILLALVLAACSKSTPMTGESNTNWLQICTSDADCHAPLACVCGTCTLECDDDASCDEQGPGTICEAPPASCGEAAEATGASCLAECAADADCGALEGAVCRSGVCARRIEASCPSFAGGIQTPTAVEATSELVGATTDVGGDTLVDADGVYYFDRYGSGALYALPHGTREPVMLRPASTTDSEDYVGAQGMVSDATHLYWSEATSPPVFEPGPLPPPGRIYAIPKAGGEPRLLLQSDDEVYRVLGLSGDRLVLQAQGAGVWTLGTGDDPTLTQLDVPLDTSLGGESTVRFFDGKLYWTVAWEGSNDEVGYFQDLFRTSIDGGPVETVARIEGYDFLAGDGRVLWWQERTFFDPLVLDQNLVMLDERTGCTQPLPEVGLSISPQAQMDARHVYWHSYNGLGAFSPDTPPSITPVLRVDLESGALEEVVTTLEPTVLTTLVGQTDDRLFLWADGTLAVIDKP